MALALQYVRDGLKSEALMLQPAHVWQKVHVAATEDRRDALDVMAPMLLLWRQRQSDRV